MSHLAQPLAEHPALNQLSKRLAMNVPEMERPISIVAGIGLIALAVASRQRASAVLALLGGACIYRGITGHCEVYRALGVNSRGQQTASGVPGNKGRKVVETIVVRRPRAEIFRYWRQLDNLPRFMPHLKKVEMIDDFRSHWVVNSVAGRTVEWHAEIINEREGELIAWQSLPGADVQNAGSVWFADAPDGATRVKVALEYYPPAGIVGDVVALLFGESPDEQLRADLQRLKQILEGQSSSEGTSTSNTLRNS